MRGLQLRGVAAELELERSRAGLAQAGHRRRLASVVLCAGALLGTALQAQTPKQPGQLLKAVDAAYYSGKAVRFTPAPGKRNRLVLGDAVLGPILSDHKPRDHRANVYVVCPGAQTDSAEGGRAINFTLVLNSLPETSDEVEWDVYWVVTLDPALHPGIGDGRVPGNQMDVTSERDLILAAQEGFEPAQWFEMAEIPGAALLRERLQIDSVAGLERFQRPDGALPRVIIVQSGLVIRASAVDPDAPAPSRWERALSRFSRQKTKQK